jgi:hypothetical protein
VGLAEALEVKEKRKSELLKIEGVSGVGVRNQRLIVYVESPDVAPEIPLRLDELRVDVVVTGKIRPLVHPLSLQAFATARTARWRPSIGGVSVGTPDITAGTLGCIVLDKSTREPLILSAGHVLSQDYGDLRKAYVGKDCIQPGRYDGGSSPADRIGGLERWVRVEYEGNLIDAAVAKPDSPDLVKAEILDVGPLYGSVEPAIGMSVYKSGRTSGYTSGRIQDIHATVKVEGWGTVVFEDQIVTSYMADPGDSGSALFTYVNNLPYLVGVLHAGSSLVTVHCKFGYVSDLLGVDVGPHVGAPEAPSWGGLVGGVAPLAAVGLVAVGQEAEKLSKLYYR